MPETKTEAKPVEAKKKDPILVMQFSFHKACYGRGCSDCEQYGRTVRLIPLSSMGLNTQHEYRKAQADLIKLQEETKNVDLVKWVKDHVKYAKYTEN